MAHTASPRSAAAVDELRHHTTKLTITLLFIILSLVALFVPGWGIMPGNMLGGGTSVELSLATSDGSTLSADELESACSVLQTRANALYEHGIAVQKSSESSVSVRVPSMYDAQTVAESLVGTGHVEFVSQLDISDADELELITSGSEDATLADGTYSAFITNDNIKGASVVTSGSGSSVTYVVQVTFDDEATAAFTAETEELSSSYGVIAVVVDGEIVATPYVSSKIETSEVSISGGFTRDEAYALTAKLESGELAVEATVGESTTFSDVCGGFAPWVAMLVMVVIAVVAGFVLSKLFGSIGWMACPSLIATALVGLGVLAVIAQFGFVILGDWELGAGICVAVLSLVASAVASQTYSKARKDGLSVRKSQQLAEASMMFIERCYVAVVVLALVATFFVTSGVNEFAWAFAAGLTAEVILAFMLKQAALCIFSTPDTVVAAPVTSNEADAPSETE